jgi:hypothetical protein
LHELPDFHCLFKGDDMKKHSEARFRRVAPSKAAAFSRIGSDVSEIAFDVGRIASDASDIEATTREIETTQRAILGQLVQLTDAVRALAKPRGKRRG